MFRESFPLTQELSERVSTAIGLPLGPYLPHNSFLLVATRAQAENIAALDLAEIEWIGHYPSHAKLIGGVLSYYNKELTAALPDFELLVCGTLAQQLKFLMWLRLN